MYEIILYEITDEFILNNCFLIMDQICSGNYICVKGHLKSYETS